MMFPLLLLAVRLTPDTPDALLKQPQLATDGRTVGVTYGVGDGVYFVSSGDGGKSFSRPALVSRSGKLSLGMHRGPRIAMTPEAIVISAIVGEKGRGADGDLLAWRSSDGGQTWSSPSKVNDVEGSAREGLHAMAAGGGVMFATWLDLRAKGTRLYGAVSRDGGKSWSKNVLVYESPSGTICQCCHPSVAVDNKGQIRVMFRNAVDGSRDMYLVRSADAGATFSQAEKIGEGTWVLNACPMDGGGVAFTAKGDPLTAWRREKEIFLAQGKGREKRVAAGKDPAIAVGRAGTYLAWTSSSAIHALSPSSSEPVVLAPEGGFPQLLALADGKVLAAWESKGTLSFQLLD